MARTSDKRDRLLDAAAEAFWVNGFAATSLADIAEKSEVPLGNIYYYFKTKAALAIGVADIFHEETLAHLAAIDETHAGKSEKIRAFMTMLRDSADMRAKLGCPLAHGVRDFSSAVPEAAARTHEVFETLIGWLSKILHDAGDKHAVRHGRAAISRWQGYIILAHGARDVGILLAGLKELENDLLIWSKAKG